MGLFQKIPLTEDVALSASALALKYPLTGADAVHLASALALRPDLFVACDRKLLSAAEEYRLSTYDPHRRPFHFPLWL